MSTLQKLEAAKGIVCLLLPLFAALAAHWRSRGHRVRGLVLLSAVAALSVGVYVRDATLGSRPYLDEHDVYHYYLAARYYGRLREDLLYDCTVVADAELPRPLLGTATSVRDLRTYKVVPRANAISQRSRCHQVFGPARWEDFKEDLRLLEGYFTPSGMQDAVLDFGTNASPTWMVTGGALARSVPVSKLARITHVDTALVLLMVLGIGWAFGAEVALIAVPFLGTLFWSHNPVVGTAILRFDWLTGSVAALCLWYRKRPGLAGVALAVAAGSKLFPMLLGAGIAARGLGRLARSRRVPRAELRFGVGFVGTLGLLCGLALSMYGARIFRDYEAKMEFHARPENIAAGRVGLPVALAWRGELPRDEAAGGKVVGEKRSLYEVEAPWARAAAILAGLGILVAGARREITDHQAWLLGAAFVPLASQMAFYYFAFLLFPAILYAARQPRPAAAVGLLALCLASGPGDIAYTAGWSVYAICAPASVLVCLWAVAVIVGVGVAPVEPGLATRSP